MKFPITFSHTFFTILPSWNVFSKLKKLSSSKARLWKNYHEKWMKPKLLRMNFPIALFLYFFLHDSSFPRYLQKAEEASKFESSTFAELSWTMNRTKIVENEIFYNFIPTYFFFTILYTQNICKRLKKFQSLKNNWALRLHFFYQSSKFWVNPSCFILVVVGEGKLNKNKKTIVNMSGYYSKMKSTKNTYSSKMYKI